MRYHSHRFRVLKKQLKVYLKKKKQRQNRSHMNPISNIIIHSQSEQIESSSTINHSTMIDFQLSPDLSKRKYIYKDITLSNNNSNQMNWVSQIKSINIFFFKWIYILANLSMYTTIILFWSNENQWYMIHTEFPLSLFWYFRLQLSSISLC